MTEKSGTYHLFAYLFLYEIENFICNALEKASYRQLSN